MATLTRPLDAQFAEGSRLKAEGGRDSFQPPASSLQPQVRRPTVAGYLYPAEAEALRRRVESLVPRETARTPAYAVVLPHGTYDRSGSIVGATLGRVMIPRRCILLGPSHTGQGAVSRVMINGAYRTPLGEVPIDERSTQTLLQRCPWLEPDLFAHEGEHALEVQLPFLQCLGPADLMVVPAVIGSMDARTCRQTGDAIAQMVRLQEEPVLLIATSDLSHYRPHAQTIAADQPLIEAMKALDAGRLLQHAAADGLAMCGEWAVACILEAATQLGAVSGELAAYGTSAEAGGDPGSAIGYAGMVIR